MHWPIHIIVYLFMRLANKITAFRNEHHLRMCKTTRAAIQSFFSTWVLHSNVIRFCASATSIAKRPSVRTIDYNNISSLLLQIAITCVSHSPSLSSRSNTSNLQTLHRSFSRNSAACDRRVNGCYRQQGLSIIWLTDRSLVSQLCSKATDRLAERHASL